MAAYFFTALAVAAVVCLWIILYDTHHFVIRHYTLSSAKLKQKTRILMLSDLHNCRYGRENKQLLEAVEGEAPDIVILAGDMITARAKEKYDGTLQLLKTLKEKYPVYYAYGNHEQKIIIKKQSFGDMGERFEESLRQAGLRPLKNERVMLPERGIMIAGLCMDHSYYQRASRPAMDKFYLPGLLGRSAGEDAYTVLIAHNPDFFPEYADWGADLVLSGHVHGGIVRIPFLGGVISPALRLFPKYDGGLYKEGKSEMIIGRGIGTHTPKVRLFNPAEIVTVDLQPETQDT